MSAQNVLFFYKIPYKIAFFLIKVTTNEYSFWRFCYIFFCAENFEMSAENLKFFSRKILQI